MLDNSPFSIFNSPFKNDLALKQGMMQELLTGRVRLTKLKIENG